MLVSIYRHSRAAKVSSLSYLAWSAIRRISWRYLFSISVMAEAESARTSIAFYLSFVAMNTCSDIAFPFLSKRSRVDLDEVHLEEAHHERSVSVPEGSHTRYLTRTHKKQNILRSLGISLRRSVTFPDSYFSMSIQDNMAVKSYHGQCSATFPMCIASYPLDCSS